MKLRRILCWSTAWMAYIGAATTLGACSDNTTASQGNGSVSDVVGGGLDAGSDAAVDVAQDATAGTLTDTVTDTAPDTGDALTDTKKVDTQPDLTAPELPPADIQPDDVQVELPELPVCPATIQITAPVAGDYVGKMATTTFAATLSGTPTPATLEVQWSSDVNGILGTSTVDAAGKTTFPTTTLAQGQQTITAKIFTSQGICATGATVGLAVCSEEIKEDFNQSMVGSAWVVAKDASWDPGGWMELTGIEKSKAGAIYNDAAYVQPGDVSLRFSIATGGGINGGADGFAMTILQANNVKEVTDYLDLAPNGGCLGYGVAPPCGQSTVVAFHVEFDTFMNNNDPFTDPTYADHIGVLLNGNAADHKVYAEVPGLEDLQWHNVRIDVKGTTVHVFYDGAEMVTKDVPELDFRGGYVIFTGSTGWATNYHRFDNLQILHKCK